MRKIWNRPDTAIWSLVTKDSEGTFNMNICSYVSAVSMKPKVMLIAVYNNTKTHDNCLVGQSVRLQLLVESQALLIRLLGQQSGKSVNKLSRLEKRGLISVKHQCPYLKDSAGFIDLTITEIISANLDHDLVLGTVTAHTNLSTEPILTTTYLRDNGYTR